MQQQKPQPAVRQAALAHTGRDGVLNRPQASASHFLRSSWQRADRAGRPLPSRKALEAARAFHCGAWRHMKPVGPSAHPAPEPSSRPRGSRPRPVFGPRHLLLLSEAQKSFWLRGASHAFSDPPTGVGQLLPVPGGREAGRTPPRSKIPRLSRMAHSQLYSQPVFHLYSRGSWGPSLGLCDSRFRGNQGVWVCTGNCAP